MATENISDEKPSFAAPSPAVPSCRKKKVESATFLEDVKDHIDEFILASMDEHKTCFQNTIKKHVKNCCRKEFGDEGSGNFFASPNKCS